jgi:hypothetical protein
VGENGPPKSGVFACNVEAVEATAKQLGRVFDELSNFDRRDDAHAADLSSSPIRNALHDFYDDSSDQREKITESVKGLRDMLQALAQGVRDVDNALADSLPDGSADQAAAGNPAGVQ